MLSKAKINAEITTLENERRRIASDLHDDVGPMLSAIKIQINHLEGQDDAERKLIGKSSKYIDDIIQKMREISNDLLPNVLVRKGLSAAVEDFLGKMKTNDLTFQFYCPNNERVDTKIEVNVYRLVQEIVHNTVKHSGATVLKIELDIVPGMLKLTTNDNGTGFDYKEMVSKKGGLGLLNLQSRTEMMGGDFDFDSEKGRGTNYLFEIPLAENA
ncbi:MAG TPA: sensor histidine kinase [Phnomibacter sp.]|nr:sensor histidine kinase [Phnomibacter sp.]